MIFPGTSAAAPSLGACAALIWSFDPSMSKQDVDDALIAGMIDLTTYGKKRAFDEVSGLGVLDTLAAMNTFPSQQE